MQKALANLKASVSRVRDIAIDIDSNAQAALANPAIQARHETTLCAASVILSGFLESFLREVAEGMVTEICNRAVPFGSLPARVQVTHYWEGATWLREIARQERSERPLLLAKASDITRRLASVGTGQVPYEILWEAFADTQSNPGPDQIGAFLKRFDISEPLPTLAQAMNTTQNTLALRLRSFIEVRNECAHTGSAKTGPTTTDVQGFCDLMEQIGDGVVAVLQTALGQPPYAVQPPAPPAPPAQPPAQPGPPGP